MVLRHHYGVKLVMFCQNIPIYTENVNFAPPPPAVHTLKSLISAGGNKRGAAKYRYLHRKCDI